jgi:putative tricarboxylic transport membrane protein
MEEINSLLQGFAVVLTPMNMLLMVVGIVLGVLIGVLPGLGGANGVAILLPLTFTMTPTSAIINAVLHLLGRFIWRRHHLHPVQHSG